MSRSIWHYPGINEFRITGIEEFSLQSQRMITVTIIENLIDSLAHKDVVIAVYIPGVNQQHPDGDWFLLNEEVFVWHDMALTAICIALCVIRELLVVFVFQSASLASIGNRASKTRHLVYNMSLAASHSYRGKWRWLKAKHNQQFTYETQCNANNNKASWICNCIQTLYKLFKARRNIKSSILEYTGIHLKCYQPNPHHNLWLRFNRASTRRSCLCAGVISLVILANSFRYDHMRSVPSPSASRNPSFLLGLYST